MPGEKTDRAGIESGRPHACITNLVEPFGDLHEVV